MDLEVRTPTIDFSLLRFLISASGRFQTKKREKIGMEMSHDHEVKKKSTW
jgi:hypothetical protein